MNSERGQKLVQQGAASAFFSAGRGCGLKNEIYSIKYIPDMENNVKEEMCVSVGGPGCGLKKVLDLIGGKWKVLILCAMYNEGPMRYGQLKKSIAGITNTMLANSLKEMENDGLVTRKQYDEMPVRVEYALTDKADGLIPILLELKKWGEEHL